MKQLDYARIIRALREKRGLTQQDVAELLGCSIPTISRIESGKSTLSFPMVEAAFQLMGENSHDYLPFFLDGEEKRAYQVMDELDTLRSQQNYKKAMQVIARVENKPPFDSGIYLQYLLFCKAEADDSFPDEDRLVYLQKAIRITKKDFKQEDISSYLLSQNEVKILTSIAIFYSKTGKMEDAACILYALRESMNRFYLDGYEKARTYPVVLYNLVVILGDLERDDEAKDICDEALKVSLKYKNYTYMPYILAAMSYYYFAKGDDHNLKEYTLRAYYTARAVEEFALAKQISDVAFNEFKLDLKGVDIPKTAVY